jgi:Aldo/keto reductase family
MSEFQRLHAGNAGTIDVGGDLTVNRLGFGAMRITGGGIWGPRADRDEAKAVLRRAIELGVNFIDTADSYGPHVSEELISEALHPYPDDLVIATKGGLERGRVRDSGRPAVGVAGRPVRAGADGLPAFGASSKSGQQPDCSQVRAALRRDNAADRARLVVVAGSAHSPYRSAVVAGDTASHTDDGRLGRGWVGEVRSRPRN